MSRLAFGAARLGERRMLTPETPSTTVEDIPSIPALQHALAQGITNVIDTSTVYGKQGASEIEIGKVMQGMDRNKVVLISKCGYQLHDDSDDTEAHTAETDVLLSSKPIPVGDNVSSYFSSSFIRDELTRSLERLQVDSLDGYLLHNPEHYLEHYLPLNGTLDMDTIQQRRDQFMKQIVLPSFITLEKEVQQGRILSYGVSSKCFNHGQTHPHYFDPDGFFSAASQAVAIVHENNPSNRGGEQSSTLSTKTLQHNFDIVQVPMNPFEVHGIRTVNELQHKHEMHVMLNRPLSPVDRLGVWRLVDGSVGGSNTTTETHDGNNIGNIGNIGNKDNKDNKDYPATPLLAAWETLPEVVRMREAREAAFAHFTPPAPEKADAPTSDEMEIIEACIFLCSLVRDMDREIDQFTSFQHYEQNIMDGIVPTIHDKMEGMDEDSTNVLMAFFEQYGKAVRRVVPFMTRARMKSILNPLANPSANMGNEDDGDGSRSSMGNTFNAFERPHTIDDATSLEEYALTWVNQIDCGQIVVGMTTKDQVDFANRWITNK